MRTLNVLCRSSFLLAGLLLTCQLLGCDDAPPAPKREYADVTGKVTYKNQPLKMGQVMFQPPTGAAVTGNIGADGTYSLKGVIGKNSVMIISQDDNGPMSADNPKSRQPPQSHIPPMYGTPGSNLNFEVKAGTNQADFALN